MPLSLENVSRLSTVIRTAYGFGLDEFLDELNVSPARRLMLKCLPPAWAAGSRPGSRAVRLREALESLGPVFVKFGQILSTRPDLLPPDLAAELTLLQDQVPAFPTPEARRAIEQSLGQSLDALFSRFDDEPLASASVAQVHTAALPDGTEVVVKVLRPGIDRIIDRDVSMMYTLARLVERHWSEGPRLRPVDIVKEYDTTIHNELDLMREAANASQLRSNFRDRDIIYVPEVYFDLCSRDVMVMERIDGIPIRDVDRLRELGIDMKKLAHDGVEIFFTQAFRDGFFHADMHPGNIFVSESGQYRAVDFGIMGTLSDGDKRYLAENFLAFFNRDYRRVAEAHVRAGWVPADTRIEEFESAIRTVCEPIFARPISEISFGKLILRLFQTARQFKMPVQPQLVLLQKTLLNIEGLGRRLYPELDLWETAKPYLDRWMSEQVGPKAVVRRMRHEWPRWSYLAPELPALAHKALSRLAEDDPSVEQLAAMQKQLARSNRRLFFAGLGMALLVAALVLVRAGESHAWSWATAGAGALLLIFNRPRNAS